MIAVHWKSLSADNPYIGKLIADFMASHDTDALTKGRIDLTDGCYVNVDEYDTRENTRFEAHKCFADVQVLLSGSEEILCAPLSDGTETVPYNPEKDITFYELGGRPYHTVELTAGTAVLLMPWDLHAPCNAAAPSHNRKLIFKIPLALAENRVRKRIACCGDSITHGMFATSPENSYPAVMQRLLGETVVVGNFGRNGATAIDTFDWRPDKHSPYRKSPQYAAAMVSEPDVAVLMLGMNDSNPTHCFHVENGGPITDKVLADYRQGLETLITDLQALPSKPQVILAATSAMRRVAGKQWSAEYVRDFTANLQIIRQVQAEIAAAYDLPFIDTLTGMDDPAYYHDGCHLTDAGYGKLAAVIHAGL